MKNSSQPIGIFDSGIGGLTVAHAVTQRLPHENIIYFGDSAHLPYGDKSATTIQRYCRNIVDFLLAQNCKLILIACNSAAAAAYNDLQNYLQQRALLLGVIDPVIAHLAQHYHDKTIGLIGTKQTVNSGVFAEKIAALPNHLTLKALATPLLVPIIEENFHHHTSLVDQVLDLYLSQDSLQNISALILACTHYPVIKPRIQAYYHEQVTLLDAGEITANALAEMLAQQQLLNTQTNLGQKQFFVSDLTPAFEKAADYFFGETISLQVKQLDE